MLGNLDGCHYVLFRKFEIFCSVVNELERDDSSTTANTARNI
jgi:hypothetical protein